MTAETGDIDSADTDRATRDEQTRDNQSSKVSRLLPAALISGGAVTIAVIRLVWPDLNLDSVTLALFVVAIIPWLGPIFKTIELPGIGKFEFQEFQRKVTRQLKQQDERVKHVAERVNRVESLAFSGTTPEQERFLSAALGQFNEYLQSLAVDVGPAPSVEVRTGIQNAYYDGTNNKIVLDAPLASDQDVVLREYTHHVLMSMRPESYEDLERSGQGVESGLADYLACSSTDDPVLGERAALVYHELWGLDRPYIRNLKNAKGFENLDLTHPQDEGEVWGGAFWEIRERLGKSDADGLLVAAWAATERFGADQPSAPFAKALIETLAARTSGALATDIRDVLERRDVRFDDQAGQPDVATD
jgi:hypothetical protein